MRTSASPVARAGMGLPTPPSADRGDQQRRGRDERAPGAAGDREHAHQLQAFGGDRQHEERHPPRDAARRSVASASQSTLPTSQHTAPSAIVAMKSVGRARSTVTDRGDQDRAAGDGQGRRRDRRCSGDARERAGAGQDGPGVDPGPAERDGAFEADQGAEEARDHERAVVGVAAPGRGRSPPSRCGGGRS